MSKKLGAILIEKGLIEQNTLEVALRAQLIYGGHLGTCLVEMDFVEEEQLGLVLAESTGRPYAGPELLESVPEQFIQRLPEEVAERYNAVPIKYEKKILHIAMIDPNNLQALDDIYFATGFKIKPWVSPEIRIVQALERYYGLQRRPRYIAICRELDQAKQVGKRRHSDRAAAQVRHRATESAVEPESTDVSPLDGQACSEYNRNWEDVATSIELEIPSIDSEHTPVTSPAALKSGPSGSHEANSRGLEDVASSLCLAENRENVSSAVLSYISDKMERCILFLVQGQRATFWEAKGFDSSREQLTQMSFPVTSNWILETLMGEEYYRGPYVENPSRAQFYRDLNAAPPSEFLLMPIYSNDQLIAFLYGDSGPQGDLRGDTDEFRQLTGMLALGMNVVISKARIRATAKSASIESLIT